MTPEQIAAARALADAATPGPWHWNVRGFVGPASTDDDQSFGMICDEVAEFTYSNGCKEANARFTAWCRDGVPALLDALAAAEARAAQQDAEHVADYFERTDPMTDMIHRADVEQILLHKVLSGNALAAIRALPPAQVADPAQIRESALRESLVLVRGYLDAWDDIAINGSSISIICDAIEALITTPPAVSDDVAALVDAATALADWAEQGRACGDWGNWGWSEGDEYSRTRAILAKLKGGV